MSIKKVLIKAVLGFATFATAYLASNLQIVSNLLPDNIENLTIGGVVSAVIVGIANYLKNKNK